MTELPGNYVTVDTTLKVVTTVVVAATNRLPAVKAAPRLRSLDRGLTSGSARFSVSAALQTLQRSCHSAMLCQAHEPRAEYGVGAHARSPLCYPMR